MTIIEIDIPPTETDLGKFVWVAEVQLQIGQQLKGVCIIPEHWSESEKETIRPYLRRLNREVSMTAQRFGIFTVGGGITFTREPQHND